MVAIGRFQWAEALPTDLAARIGGVGPHYTGSGRNWAAWVDIGMAGAIHEGGCLCGAVRYRTTAPATETTRCHCRSCRRATGAPAVAWTTFPRAAFAVVAGEIATVRSSPPVQRTFCARCGTPLGWAHDDDPDTLDLTTASLDDADAFAPECELWVSEKLAWQALDPALPHYARGRREGGPLG